MRCVNQQQSLAHAFAPPPRAEARPAHPRPGVHALRLVLPPDAPAWEAELYVVHIAGEGLADPPVPRPFPANLVNFNDGPPIYNLRAPVEGHLHAADWYVSPSSLAGSDAYAPHSAQGIPPRRPSSDAVLPLCGSGDHAGRWVFHHSLYPDVFGEPLQWRPLGCRYERISGARLRQCLDQPGLGNVQLAGESTLGQSFELLLAHMNASNYYWPARILEPAARLLWAHPRLRSAGLASEYHGIDQMMAHTLGDLRGWKPDVLVMLQGANDAARDSVAAFSTRLQAFLQALKEAIDAGEIAPRRLVWATAPIRSYKTGGLPGRLSCPEGTPESCLAVSGGSSVLIDGTLQWVQRPSDVKPLQFYGTIDRRRSLNRIAVERVKALFPTALILDYEALTAGLPSDYCIDGEHWGCPHVAWNGRFREAYQCRSLGNIVFSNILANLICSTPRAPHKH